MYELNLTNERRTVGEMPLSKVTKHCLVMSKAHYLVSEAKWERYDSKSIIKGIQARACMPLSAAMDEDREVEGMLRYLFW